MSRPQPGNVPRRVIGPLLAVGESSIDIIIPRTVGEAQFVPREYQRQRTSPIQYPSHVFFDAIRVGGWHIPIEETAQSESTTAPAIEGRGGRRRRWCQIDVSRWLWRGRRAALRGGMVDGVKRERLREGRRLRTMGGGGGGRRSQRRRLLWCFFIEG